MVVHDECGGLRSPSDLALAWRRKACEWRLVMRRAFNTREQRATYAALPTGFGEVECPTRASRLRPRRLYYWSIPLIMGVRVKL